MAVRSKTILIFGESDTDRAALAELFRALRPDLQAVGIQKLREPLILMKPDNRLSTQRNTTNRIAGLVQAQGVSKAVLAVIVHQDCDEVEPGHTALADKIEKDLRAANVPNPIAATPAWEIEAWWMLFPDAVQATRPCWAPINFGDRDVGRIHNAKEELQRRLRPVSAHDRAKCPDYAEADGIEIARKIRTKGLIDNVTGLSASFSDFKGKIRNLKIGSRPL